MEWTFFLKRTYPIVIELSTMQKLNRVSIIEEMKKEVVEEFPDEQQ